MDRKPMTSFALQKQFQQEYQNFFQENGLVVSGNFVFPWSPIGVGHRSKFIRIKSKIPLKMFVGINENDSGEVRINKVINYDINKDEFEEFDFNSINKRHIEILQVIKDEIELHGYKKGLEINILTEGTRGHGLGFTGNFGAGFAIGFYILLGKLNNDFEKSYDSFLESDIFKEIFLLSRKIDFVSRDGNSIGDNSMFTFAKTEFPMIAFSESFERNIDIKKLNNIKYKCISLNKLFENNINCNELPFDYAIVFSGLKNDSSKIEQYTKADEARINSGSEFINQYLQNHTNDMGNVSFLNFLKGQNFYDTFVDTFSILSIQMIEKFKNIYQEGCTTGNTEDFIRQINVFRYFMSMIEKSNPFPEDFVREFKSDSNNEHIGIMPIYSGKIGGGYVVVMDYQKGRDYFNKTLDKLKINYPYISVDYASWIDGNIGDGIKINQYIKGGIFSPYIQKDNVVCQNNLGEKIIGNYDTFINNYDDGMLLDNIGKKIYIKGKKLTSQDISSQSTTIDILIKLINSIGKEISNKELPPSSYSKNKNEMVGKIIIPISKIIEKEFNQTFPILCKGGFGDFFIRLEKTNFKIYIVSNI